MEKIIRVFVASPSREFIELFCDALAGEQDFLTVGVALRGDEAYAHFLTSHADLLVTDLLLPGLDGLSLLRRLKEAACLPHAIVVSGFYNDRMARIVSSLADNYLPKPCRLEDLLRHMRESVYGPGAELVRDYDTAVARLLSAFGILPHLNGFAYLRSALGRALSDRSQLRGVTKSLYRDIAKEFSTTPACVERSIRSAIERAWARETPEQRRACFGPTFDACTKAPSNLAFLTSMTEYIDGLFSLSAVGD